MRLNRLWCALRFQHGTAMLVIGPDAEGVGRVIGKSVYGMIRRGEG